MYRCQSDACKGRQVPEGNPAFRKVVQQREVRYSPRPDIYLVRKGGEKRVTGDPGGQGIEIAKEITVCFYCKEDKD
jgi:hypothetical protein